MKSATTIINEILEAEGFALLSEPLIKRSLPKAQRFDELGRKVSGLILLDVNSLSWADYATKRAVRLQISAAILEHTGKAYAVQMRRGRIGVV